MGMSPRSPWGVIFALSEIKKFNYAEEVFKKFSERHECPINDTQTEKRPIP